MRYTMIAGNQIVMMFIIMIIGIILYKIKMIDQNTNKSLSNILLMVINPLLLFQSYQKEYEVRLVHGLMISFGLAVIATIVSVFTAYIAIKKTEKSDYRIERFSAVYSNCGFFGIPLINSLFGSEGVFYLTAYMTVFNLMVWSHGVSLMTGKKTVKDMIKIVQTPAIIAVALGLLCFFLRIRLPEIIMQPVSSIAGMNTPFAMIVAGVAVAQSNLLEVFKKSRILLVSLIKLLVIPIMLIYIFKVFKVPEMVIITTIVETACPAATIGTMFAIRFNRDYKYSSEIFAITTIFSMITIPVVIYLAGIL